MSFTFCFSHDHSALTGMVKEMAMSSRFKFRVGALTAALQDAVSAADPRAYFLEDPLGAARESACNWLNWAKSMGADGIELAAALPLPDSYMDYSTMLDPVAAHLAVRTFRDGGGVDLSEENAQRLIQEASANNVQIWSLGFFENLLHHDPTIQDQGSCNNLTHHPSL